MTQSALNRSVARATGESIGMIRKLGFVLLLLQPAADQQKSESPTPTDKSPTSKYDLNDNPTRSA